MRVYELAKQLSVSSKELLEKLAEKENIKLASHMSVLPEDAAQFLQDLYAPKPKSAAVPPKAVMPEKQPDAPISSVIKKEPVVESRQEKNQEVQKSGDKSQTIQTAQSASVGEPKKMLQQEKHINRTKHSTGGHNLGKKDSHGSKQPEQPKEPAMLSLSKTYTVADLAIVLHMNPVQLTMFYLKKGKLYSINSLIPADDLKAFANDLNYTIIQDNQSAMQTLAADSFAKHGEPRAPIIVVMGHVDHGKTTLIDYIRKTKVAEREKGGITQTVRVYNVPTPEGEIVLIDTPGHEAFSSMRGRGSQATDIVVLIVAADDGVMPQTVESIKLAKEMKATVIVAINKIDKPGVEGNLDKIYQQLSQHGLLVEAWAGDVVCVNISAKTGQGVDDLLEMVHLQAELLDLRSDYKAAGKAYVLESQSEKGLGSTAVVIVKQGTVSKADFFIVGNQAGKIKALFDFAGNPVDVLTTGKAGKVVGLEEVASAGQVFKIVSEAEVLNFKPQIVAAESNVFARTLSGSQTESVGMVKLIIKADTVGALEAISKCFDILAKKNKKVGENISIVASSIGDVFEKDIILAADHQAMIVGMNVKLDGACAGLAKQHAIVMVFDQIIYRLIDAVEAKVLEKLKSIKKLKETGQAVVRKVFDLKSKGVVAGCYVKEGFFDSNSIVQCWRAGKKIGEGKINSLEHERNIVKVVNAGKECGFVCGGFRDWQEGDSAIAFVQIGLDQD